MLFNGGLIPTYLLVKSLHMLNTIWAVVLPGAVSAYNVIVARTFFANTIPKELQEAAEMDGCADFLFFIKIVIPLSTPIIAVLSLWVIVGLWNSYFWPLVMTNSDKIRPVTLAMQRLQDANQGLEWPILMAANTLVVLPVLVLFLALSSQILKSLGYKGSK